jgi:integrase/recombinase XerD
MRRGQRRRTKRADSLLLSPPPQASPLRHSMHAHLRWMQQRHYTAASVQGRADALSLFATWCEERGLSSPEEVDRPVVERYQRHLFHYRKASGRPLSAGTQYGRLAGVRGYFRWATRQGLVAANPAADVDMPRKGRALPPWVPTAEEVERVLAQPDTRTPSGVRDRAMLETLYSTGMRRFELCSLSMHGVRPEAGVCLIRQGKGRKDRVVPIGQRALAWVERYLSEVRPQLVVPPDEGHLFLTEAGEAFHPNRLTHVVRGYVRAAGVAARGACHLFRHAMATLMLEGGADVRFVQEMLGHASLEATQVYTHVSVRKLKEIHAATHPAARLEAPGAEATGDEARAALLSSLAAEVAAEEEELEGHGPQ